MYGFQLLTVFTNPQKGARTWFFYLFECLVSKIGIGNLESKAFRHLTILSDFLKDRNKITPFIMFYAHVEALLIIHSISNVLEKRFLQYALFILFNAEKKTADGGTIKTITKETLSEFRFDYPCIEEQQKIAEFFSVIDEQIEIEKK